MTPDNILHAINARLLDNTGNWATNMKCMNIFHALVQDKSVGNKTSEGCKRLHITLQNYVKAKGKETKGKLRNSKFVYSVR